MYAHLFTSMKSYKSAAPQRSPATAADATAKGDGFAHLFPGIREAAQKAETAPLSADFIGQRALDIGRTRKSEKGVPPAALRDPIALHFLTSKTPAFQFFLANRRPNILT